MQSSDQNEHIEVLLSCLVDGELTAEEREELQEQLDSSESAQQLLRDFHDVDSAVALLAMSPKSGKHGLTETIVVTRQKPTIKNWLSVWRLVPLAAVASLLIGLMMVTLQPAPKTATAKQFSTDDYVKPLAELNRINQQNQRDQDLMVRTLSMDLRALKLELKQLQSANPEEREQLEKQIEAMLKRVEEFGTNE